MFEEWESGGNIKDLVRRIRELPAWGLIAVGAALVTAVLASGGWLSGQVLDESGVDPVEADVAGIATVTASPAEVVVHVVGAVRQPGVYKLGAGSRVADAIASAGGVLGNAAPEAVNLARVLTDGEQVRVPTTDEASSTVNTADALTGAARKIDINSASAQELETLPGIGPATAKRIIEDRARKGPFTAPEDLMRVPGIGPKKYDAIKDLITTG